MGFTTLFGLPRCGKTTTGVRMAIKEQQRMDRGVGRYKRVFTNFPVKYPGICQIDVKKELGKVEICDSLVIIDEAYRFADGRRFTELPPEFREFMFQHGHWRIDIIWIVQDWNCLDTTIRRITERVFYIKKGKIFTGFTWVMPVPYDVIIPKKDSDTDKLGEIIQGYCQPPWYVKLFQTRYRRDKWYQYFDSWEHQKLPDPVLRPWTDQDGEWIDYSSVSERSSADLFNNL